MIITKHYKELMIYNSRMNLSSQDKERILQSFPSFKLSYEKRNHKKFSSTSDFFITIPKGQKYFAWFRHFKKHNVYTNK